MKLRTEHVEIEDLDAVPRIAAETIVAQRLVLVDDTGRPRVDIFIRDDGPALEMLDQTGDRAVSLTAIEEDGECYSTLIFWRDGNATAEFAPEGAWCAKDNEAGRVDNEAA